MRHIATIGVYGFTREAFLEVLAGAGVGLLLDVRQPEAFGATTTPGRTRRSFSAHSPGRTSATGT